MTDSFLGIDSGRDATRVVAIDGDTGDCLAAATRPHATLPGLPEGYREQDPADWIAAARACIREVLAAPGVAPAGVRAIGVAGQRQALVPLDDEDAVLRPAKLADDTSAARQRERLVAGLGGDARVLELTGFGLPPGATAAKLLWLKELETQNFERLACVLLPHDYLNFWLTGEKMMEYGDASATGLMDIRTRTWSPEVTRAVDAEAIARLPILHPSDGIAGLLKEDVAADLGLAGEIVVSAGGGESMMNAIGTGNTRPGVVTAGFGATGMVCAASEIPVVDPEGEVTALCDGTNRWMALVRTRNVTAAAELVKRGFGWDDGALTTAVESVPAGADGLVCVPYFAGEWTPNVPEGTGGFIGLSERTFSAAHMARSAMEGATLGMSYGLNRMRGLGVTPQRVRLTGPGARNRAWRQIIADVFGAEVVCMRDAETTAIGAAIHAKWAHDNFRGRRAAIQALTDALVHTDETTRQAPDPGKAALYADRQKILDEASKSLRGVFSIHRAVTA